MRKHEILDTSPMCVASKSNINSNGQRQYQYQIKHQYQGATSWKVNLAPWVHGWKLKHKSTDRLSIHSCISPSTFLNARDPTFPIGAGWHSWEARSAVVNFRQPHASKASRTPATLTILFGIEAPPSAQPSRLPSAQGADLGWKLDS